MPPPSKTVLVFITLPASKTSHSLKQIQSESFHSCQQYYVQKSNNNSLSLIHLKGCRRPSELEATLSKCREAGLKSGTYECLQLDLMTLESVRKFAEVILKKNIPIHVLVNNGNDSPLITFSIMSNLETVLFVKVTSFKGSKLGLKVSNL
jgi:hypothetical protein